MYYNSYMKKILILGNGFDLNDEMKTTFRDFSEYYNGPDFVFDNLKRELSSDIDVSDFSDINDAIQYFVEEKDQEFDEDDEEYDIEKHRQARESTYIHWKNRYYDKWNRIEDILSEDIVEIMTNVCEFMDNNNTDDSQLNNNGDIEYVNEPKIRMDELISGDANLLTSHLVNSEILNWIIETQKTSKRKKNF